MNCDTKITQLRQARDATETKLSEARHNLSAAQSAYAKARKEERAALLAYVEAMEASQSTGSAGDKTDSPEKRTCFYGAAAEMAKLVDSLPDQEGNQVVRFLLRFSNNDAKAVRLFNQFDAGQLSRSQFLAAM